MVVREGLVLMGQTAFNGVHEFSSARTWRGAPVNGIQNAFEASRKLLDLGVRSAVLTLGSEGAVASETGVAFHAPAPKVDVVDTTGAGNAFAVHAGALAITKARAQSSPPSVEELELSTFRERST